MVKIDAKNELIKSCILAMAKKVSNMYEVALEAIEENNNEKALKVIRMDEYVNLAEEDINDLAIDALALLSPVASDLRNIVSSIKIATELERIADYAKAMAKFIIKSGPLDNEILNKTRELGDVFLAMFDHAMDAYDKADANWAISIPEEDARINEIFNEILEILKEKSEAGDKQVLERLIPTIRMMRNLERAGDHTKNICEHIIYQVKGKHFEFN